MKPYGLHYPVSGTATWHPGNKPIGRGYEKARAEWDIKQWQDPPTEAT